MPDRMSEDMPDRMSEDMPDRMPDRMPEDMSDRMPENMPEDMSDRMPEDMSDRIPEDMPDRMPENMPDRMPEDMTEDMPDRMPNRLSEDMSDRMPEDLPVRKCINVMVGITRSKVILERPESNGRHHLDIATEIPGDLTTLSTLPPKEESKNRKSTIIFSHILPYSPCLSSFLCLGNCSTPTGSTVYENHILVVYSPYINHILSIYQPLDTQLP